MEFLLKHFWKFLLFRLYGWKFVGTPTPEKKVIVLGAYHTSNWDFALCMGSQYIAQRKVLWLAKHTLFWGPLGVLMRAMGGLPVNRSQKQGLVKIVTDEFAKHDDFILALCPEGTRKYTPHWKLGFYQIAMATGVPLQCMGFHWGAREIVWGPLFYASGDVEKDFVILREFFHKTVPKFPALAEVNFTPEPPRP